MDTRDYRDSWWWTPARARTVCDRCGEELASGDRMAFRPRDERCLCTWCADTEEVASEAKPSEAWRRVEAERNERSAT